MKNLLGQNDRALAEIMAEWEITDRNAVHQRVIEAFHDAGFLVGNNNSLVDTSSPRIRSYLSNNSGYKSTVRVDIASLSPLFKGYAQESMEAIVNAPSNLPVKMVDYKKGDNGLQVTIKRHLG